MLHFPRVLPNANQLTKHHFGPWSGGADSQEGGALVGWCPQSQRCPIPSCRQQHWGVQKGHRRWSWGLLCSPLGASQSRKRTLDYSTGQQWHTAVQTRTAGACNAMLCRLPSYYPIRGSAYSSGNGRQAAEHSRNTLGAMTGLITRRKAGVTLIRKCPCMEAFRGWGREGHSNKQEDSQLRQKVNLGRLQGTVWNSGYGELDGAEEESEAMTRHRIQRPPSRFGIDDWAEGSNVIDVCDHSSESRLDSRSASPQKHCHPVTHQRSLPNITTSLCHRCSHMFSTEMSQRCPL